jgi:hypothetical protein
VAESSWPYFWGKGLAEIAQTLVSQSKVVSCRSMRWPIADYCHVNSKTCSTSEDRLCVAGSLMSHTGAPAKYETYQTLKGTCRPKDCVVRCDYIGRPKDISGPTYPLVAWGGLAPHGEVSRSS